MRIYARLLLAGTALALSLSGTSSYAAGTGGVDRMLQQAIKETAMTPPPPPVEEAEPAPAPVSAMPAMEPETVETTPVTEEAMAEEAAPENVAATEPMGFVFGNMRWSPVLAVEQAYSDNVLAAPSGEIDDFITTIRPSVRAEMINSPNGLTLDLSYEAQQYWSESDENVQNYAAAIAGHVQGATMALPYLFSYRLDHEDRADDLTRQLPTEPIETEEIKAEGGAQFKRGKLGFLFMGRFLQEKFDDGLTPGGTLVVRHDADRESWQGDGELSYELSPDHKIMIGALYGTRQYDGNNYTGGSFTGVLRDSERTAGWLGWEGAFKGLLTGNVRLGFESRDYDDNSIEDIENIMADIGLNWHVTDTGRFILSYQRGHYEDDEVVTPILRSATGLGYEQILWDQVNLGLRGGWETHDFEGTGREDDIITIRATADYMLSDYLTFGGEYRFENRDSSTSGLDYDRNLWLLRLAGKL